MRWRGILLAASVLTGAPAEAGFRAGAAKVDITPERPLRLAVGAGRAAPLDGAEDRLFARALVIEDSGGVLTALVGLDLIGVPARVREQVCGAIRPRLGIYRVRIALAATGARSSPALRGLPLEGAPLSPQEDEEVGRYAAALPGKIVAAVTAAIGSLRPARIIHGSRSVPFAAEPLQAIAAIADGAAGGDLIAAVLNAPAAAAALPEDFNRISGDWPGFACAAIEADRPGAVALALAGGAAEAPPEPRGSMARARSHGRAAASALAEILGAPEGAIEEAIDAQFEYVEHSGASVPVQVWRSGDRLAMVFLGAAAGEIAAGLRRDPAPARLWITGRANDLAGPPSPEQSEAVIATARRLLAAGAGGPASRVKPPPPLSPSEALASFRIAPGLRIELAAAEPDVTDPVAIAFDESGRMLVAEMRDYPLGPGDGKPFDGRVRVLEDRDLDGRFERSSILAAEVPFPTGIACWRGGVFVTCAPDVIYLRDSDGDGRADERRVVYTGFNIGNSQHLLNALQPGIDNWIHGNGGDHGRIRCAADPSIPELVLERGNFRFHPGRHRIEATTGYRGGYGIGFDDHGERFVCDSLTHAIHVVIQSEYLHRNLELPAGAVLTAIADHDSRIYPASRPLERFNDPMDSGRFSSASGVHIYGGDALPEPYRGSLFVCEPVSNLVHRDALVRSGATFIARRGEEGTEFLASTDHWFRPVSCATGPDGALYVIDMYREVIEHPEWIPLHIQKLFDLRSGMDRGRIYRVVPGEAPPRQRPALAGAPASELAAALESPNRWRRQTAQRLLVERGAGEDGAGAAPLLEDLLARSDRPLARLHALWTLSGIERLRPRHAAAALGDPHPAVRSAAARLAEGLLAGEAAVDPAELAEIRRRLAGLSADPDAAVRFQAALSIGALPAAERLEPLARIAARDPGDSWMQTAVLASLPGSPVRFLEALLAENPAGAGLDGLARRIAAWIGRRRRPAEVASGLALLGAGGAAQREPWRLAATAELLEALGPGGLRSMLAAAAGEEAAGAPLAGIEALQGSLDDLFAALARRAAEAGAALDERRRALDLLGHADSAAALEALAGFLGPRHPPELQEAAARGLARLGDAALRERATALLLEALPRQTPRARGESLDALLGDAERIAALLEAIESGAARAADIDLERRRRLLEHPEEPIRQRAARIFAGAAVDPDRAAVVERYRGEIESIAGAGDPGRGRTLFEKNCASCHRLGDLGTPVGPDLAAMAARAPEALLADILDPARAISPEYASYLLITRDRRTLSGLLASETPGSVVLLRAEGKTDDVLRRDILELRAATGSLMPAGLEQQLDPAALRDLIAYLKTPAAWEGSR